MIARFNVIVPAPITLSPEKSYVAETFEDALNTRKFEPDAPNYTPRISGVIDLNDKQYTYKFSIIKSIYNEI